MRWSELQRKEEIPQTGYLLAYTKTQVVFEKYSAETVHKLLGEDELLEVHCFDSNKEYRAISSESQKSKHQKKGFIEWVADFERNPEETYEETVLMENAFKSSGKEITVLNHVNYTEEGMAEIDDFRLIMPETEENNGK